MAVSLISLAQYTRPARIVFGDGSFQREGMDIVLQWMVDNRDKGYFVNLEYFQMTGHKCAAYNTETTADHVASDPIALADNIVSNLATICADKVNFPKLSLFNFHNNAYNENEENFDAKLRAACSKAETGVTINARQVNVAYPTMCDDSPYNNNNYFYYDMTDVKDRDQCRFTWNWEMNSVNMNYAGHGPYPNDNTIECE